MTSQTGLPYTVESELVRRHKAAATTVMGLLVATVLLCVIAYLSKRFVTPQNNPSLDIAVRITIMIFGLGSIVLRRTRFATMRLQDIGALGGASALLKTLEKTTLQVALIGAVLSVLGFAATLITGNDFYTYGAGLIAIVILLYCYPTKTSWIRTIQRFARTEDEPKSTVLALD
ncbi:MAG TPA: hypothetical protein VFH15_02365 [Pyrinomonadaceae bacterium]|nr:hypothetical protein [Pyrinomonadaceae bacterium]